MSDCDCPIERLDIVPYMDGGTRISWHLARGTNLNDASTLGIGNMAVGSTFRVGPSNYTKMIELQVSRYDTPDPSVWTTLATVAADSAYYVDTSKRTWGSLERIYYRARLLPGCCFSRITPSKGGMLDCREPVSIVREILRRERLRHESGEASLGTLLKRKFSGIPCTDCVDPDYPGRQIESFCLTCYQTGWVGGYYLNPSFYADLGESGTQLKTGDNLDVEGSDRVTTLRYLNIPDVQPGDVWVEYSSDHRWHVDKVRTLSKVSSYVLIAAAEVRRLGFEDVVYKYPVPRY